MHSPLYLTVLAFFPSTQATGSQRSRADLSESASSDYLLFLGSVRQFVPVYCTDIEVGPLVVFILEEVTHHQNLTL